MGEERKIIMMVDDQATNLAIGKNMLKDMYKVYTIPSADILFNLLKNVTPDLILLDIVMPEMNGYDAIKILKANPKWAQIPVIFLTGCTDEDSELQGLSMGAADYIMKPFSAPLLRKRIENQIVSESHKKGFQMLNDKLSEMARKKLEAAIHMQDAMLGILTDMVEFKDDTFSGHVQRTQKYMEIMLEEIMESGTYKHEVADWDRHGCVSSAQLHDIGKITVSDAILSKEDKLTEEEFEAVKTHVDAGLQMIAKLEALMDDTLILKHAREIIAGHHERWDGLGYPAGLKGHEIPLEGRLMAIADVYDALISKRPYKEAHEPDEAQLIIEQESGTRFDPELVRLFSKAHGRFKAVACEIT